MLFFTDLSCFGLSRSPPYLWLVRNSFLGQNGTCFPFGLLNGLFPITCTQQLDCVLLPQSIICGNQFVKDDTF